MSGSDMSPARPASGSGPVAAARVELASRNSSLELSIVASDFRPLASGVGRLSVEVPPGIYQLVARAGPVVERKLIRLDPGGVYSDADVAVRFPAPAPVTDTSTSHEYQQDAAQQASQAAAQMAGPPSALVIVVRDVRGYDGPPMEAGDVACFGLVDQSLNPVPGFDQGWSLKPKEAVAVWSGRLPSGGYALRTDPARAQGGARRPATSQAFDQSIWLSANWQTVVFITTGEGGPRTSAASVHMAQVGIGWSPYETEVGLALELAHWGLRMGRSVVPENLLNVLLGTKFVNPMLGIVGAHSLLLRADTDPGLLEIVLSNLENMVPGHPDVIALRWMAAARRGGAGVGASTVRMPPAQPAPAAIWPPMMLPSYRALIEMDAAHPTAIADGSPAERAAANLLIQGIWTNWMPLPPVPPGLSPEPPRRRIGRARRGLAAAAVLPALSREPALIERVPLEDPATARVAGYLGALAALEGPTGRAERFATLTREEIGLATTLPAATVDRAMASIAAAVTPGGGAGGGSAIRTSLSFVAAGTLLLAGALGVVALCAGSDVCSPAPAETPTPVITPEPTSTPRPTGTSPPATSTPEPTPILLEHPATIEFGQITIGGKAGELRLTVLAAQQVDLRFEVAENPGDAYVVGECEWADTASDLLGCTVVVTFTPRQEGAHLGALAMLVADDPDPRTIQLVGEGVAPFLRFRDRVEFGSVTIGFPRTESLIVFATEPVDLQFGIIEDATGAFSTDPTCKWVENEFGLFECAVLVGFDPRESGGQVATLGIFTAEPEPRRIELVGEGFFQIL